MYWDIVQKEYSKGIQKHLEVYPTQLNATGKYPEFTGVTEEYKSAINWMGSHFVPIHTQYAIPKEAGGNFDCTLIHGQLSQLRKRNRRQTG